jgi:GDP-L-fucose synthase
MLDASILSEFTGKRVLVTGGTGMIGRHVTHLLGNAQAKVTVVSLDNIRPDPRAEYLHADLTNYEICRELTQRKDFVFHLAGIKASMEISTTMVASHFVPTLMMNTNVLESCRLNQVGRVLYTSSIGAYEAESDFVEKELGQFEGPPMDFAGWAKRMGELQIAAYQKQYGLKHFSIVRPSAVYGPGDNFDPATAMVVPSLFGKIKSGQLVEVWGDGSAVRDIAFSEDVAEGIILSILKGSDGYVNLGSGVGITIRDLVQVMREITPFEFKFDTSKPSGKKQKLLNLTKAKRILGYVPMTNLKKGLGKTWKWFRENSTEHENRHNYFR